MLFWDNMVPISHTEVLLLLQRRATISLDKDDINTIYVHQLGDVQIKSQENMLHDYMLKNLNQMEKKSLQVLSTCSKSRIRGRFSTVTGMRRRRRSQIKPSVEGQSLIDDYYRSSTKCLLSKTCEWKFDVFTLDQLSNGRPLFYMVLKLFQEHNLIEHFNLDIIKLMKFASLVEEGYHQNPYHNAVHAADVTQAMHCYILQEKIARHLSPLETMVALLSAITHDLHHPGVNQAFLIATSNHLASLYNNNSVLENHHWRSAVGILHESSLFDHLPLSIRKNIIKQMKSLILATDMTRQQEFYSRLRAHISKGDLDMSKAEDRHFILQIALKCADISNPCRTWSTCKKWSHRVCDEFFQQGDFERNLSLPITNLCDRSKFTVAGIQVGFIDFVVEPLFKEFHKFLSCDMLTEQMVNLRSNRTQWTVLATEQRFQCQSVDINSNLEAEEGCNQNKTDDQTDSCGVPSPACSESTTSCDPDEVLSDISQVHTDIALVAERMDWMEKCSDRRSSFSAHERNLSKDTHGRRESFPLIHDNRRAVLPPTNLHQAISFDQLVENLTNINRSFTLTSKRRAYELADVSLDNLLSETRLSTLSPSSTTSKLSKLLVSKRLL